MKIKQSKTTLGLIGIVAVGLVLGAVILSTDKAKSDDGGHGHGHEEAAGHADTEHHGKEEAGHEDDDKHEDGEHHEETAEPQKGPHGGRLFTGADGVGVELTIFETGVEPEFRAYLFKDGKPVPPSQGRLSVSLERLGREPERFEFQPQQDYLRSAKVVEEPHSFTARLQLQAGGKTQDFSFEQVEARVAISDAQLKANGVVIQSAGPARIRSSLQLPGEVKLNADRAVIVVPRLNGLVESVAVNAGDRVKRGQLLAVLSSQAVADQRSELLAAQKRQQLARSSHDREKRLWEAKVSAEQDYLAAQAAL